jgi:hypothetical protein
MKNIVKLNIVILLITILFISNILPPIRAIAKVDALHLNKSSLSLEVGSSDSLKVTGTGKKVIWSSGNKTVASVSGKGKVKALSVGSTTITASVSGKKLTCKVTVTPLITLSKNNLSLDVGRHYLLSVTGSSKIVKWSSDNTSIAKVTTFGKVIGVSEGTATITANTEAKTLQCKVTVNNISFDKLDTPSPDYIISFPDQNFKDGLLKNNADLNGDGEISYAEACQVSQLFLFANNIQRLNGIEYFTNLTYLDIRNNNIEDISLLRYLYKLKCAGLTNNHLKASPLTEYEEDTMKTAALLRNNGCSVEGLELQIIDYDKSQSDNKPVYKVLFVYVMDIDAKATDVNGLQTNVKISLNDSDIVLFDEYRRMFEMYVEKLSNYAMDMQTSSYTTTKTLTEYGVGYSSIGKEYYIFASNISEIHKLAQNYDTVMVCAMYNNQVYHSATGLGIGGNGYGDAMIYFNRDMNYSEALDNMKENRYDGIYLTSLVHEFIHTVEGYSGYLGNQVWEFHSALGTYYDVTEELKCMSDYLIGTKMPNENRYGIPEEVWASPPSKTIRYKDKY